MRRHVDERALVVLAVDLDQRRPERLEHLHAHRLVIHEGAGAPVGELHAPQDQAVLGGDAVLGEQRERRMAAFDVERRRDLALFGAVAHQAGIAAAAERQREGIEQDRLAGAGLAGQHRQSGRIVDVEPFDENDVADREAREHSVLRSFRGAGAAREPGIHNHETRGFETAVRQT